MMKTIKLLLFVISPFLFFLTNVSALSLSEASVGYGYTQEYNGVITSRTWVAYNSNNLIKYNYNLPNSSVIDIDTFNFRFRISDKFLSGNNYILTFTWFNDWYDFSLYYSRMIHDIYCYSSSWNSTAQTSNTCFSIYNISYSTTSNSNIINITLSFTPVNDIYGIAFINEHDNDPYSSFPSEGWEITNINYQVVSSGTSEIINNQNQNTDNIINNQNQNTQDIIDNQNQNTQQQINSQLVCSTKHIDKNNVGIDNAYINSSGTVVTNANDNLITEYIDISKASKIKVVAKYNATSYNCYYNSEYTRISCFSNTSINVGDILSIPDNAKYVRFSIRKSLNVPTFDITLCENGNQAITDSLTDSNSSGASTDAENFFGNFTTETYGLTGVITAPLNVIQSITSKTCSPLVLPLPFVNQNLTLPCMGEIYSQYFGDFLTIYQTITFGIVAYWVVVRIFNLVKDFKNPDHDEVEVLDL